ncbi:MAG: SpoIVB peptidase [Bacillota bacterium]|nr:SpoIVB peptidase [Candidatus Fermentithermobacillaceae bacterium]
MITQRTRMMLGVFLSLLVVAVCMSGSFRLAFSFPSEMTLLKGQDFVIDTGSPVVSVSPSDAPISNLLPWSGTSTRLSLDTKETGHTAVEFRLFGLIPIRRVSLSVQEPVMVVPGGHSIGVVLRSSGLLITGLAPVETVDGRHVWPARNADLEAGDVIISVGDQKIGTKEEFALIIDRAGREGRWVDILVEKADGSAVRRTLMPVRHRNGGFQIGLLVKDALAGVGTLTFYDADTGLYTALGHMISEGDSRRPVSMNEGHIVRATVTGVNPSRKGLPGEVLGTFLEGHDVIGTILQNGECGISGVLSEPLDNGHYPEPIPLGLQGRLRRGPAEVLTTIEGTSIERFSVEIEQIFTGSQSLSKGFVVRVTDPRLLSLTGGIVQGMSGSPIIQDGYLVGAITHVLVNDPARGYGTFAEWMARNAYMLSGTVELPEAGAALAKLAPGPAEACDNR